MNPVRNRGRQAEPSNIGIAVVIKNNNQVDASRTAYASYF
jgi:hypothetical protein